MIVSLANGKSIEVSLEQYLRMSDDDFNFLVARNYGDEIADPFHSSHLKDGHDEIDLTPVINEDSIIELEPEIEDLTSITDEEKLLDDEFLDLD